MSAREGAPPSDGDPTSLPAVLPQGRVVYAVEKEAAALTGQERDFVLLTLFVLVQHCEYDKAGAIAEALIEAGDTSAQALLGHAVIAFCRHDYAAVLKSLATLDRVDPIERYGQRQGTERERMRSYLRARSLHERGEGQSNAIDLYLRHAKGNADND
ncbi:MAG: hypothetical protein AAF318_01305 [Pseudomonadota bacterium]